jgi:hypothetical protein
LLVFLAGARGLNADPIWYDEWYALYYAGAAPQYGPLSVSQTVERTLEYQEFNPPGYYVLLNLWGHIAGWTPYATRVLSLLLGMLGIAFIYRLGCDLVSPLAGLSAALALGSSAYLVNQMHEIRMYPLFVLLMIASLWAYWRLISEERVRLIPSLALLFLTLVALLYTHYMALPLLASLALFHLVFMSKTRRWWQIAGVALLSGLAFLPWISVGLRALSVVSGETSRQELGYTPLQLLNTGLTQFSNGAQALLAVFGWYALRRRGRNTLFVGTLVLGTFCVYLVINTQFHVIGSPRYLMALWPPLALLVGLGVEHMSRWQLRPAVLLTIWVLIGAGYIAALQTVFEPAEQSWQVYLPWDKLADKLRGQTIKGDQVAFLLPAPTPYWFHAPVAAYYFHDQPVQVETIPPWINIPVVEHPDFHIDLVESLAATTPQDFRNQADDLLRNGSALWLAYSPTYFPSPFAKPEFDRALAEHGYILCQPNDAKLDLRLDLYARVIPDELSVRFGEGIRVKLLSRLPGAIETQLPLRLGWSIESDVPPNTYSLGLHVDNAEGQLVAQRDFALPFSGTACSLTSLPLASLPAGQYTLYLVVYNWQTQERLVGIPPNSRTTDRLALGQFSILAS